MIQTRKKLQVTSNIPNTGGGPTFDQLYEVVRLYIRAEPDDSIILGGQQRGGQTFRLRLIEYIDSGLGQQFWAPENQGDWIFDRDRERYISCPHKFGHRISLK